VILVIFAEQEYFPNTEAKGYRNGSSEFVSAKPSV
jgi:hypothetical protein